MTRKVRRPAPAIRMAAAWFPVDQWPEARRRWSDLRDPALHSDHGAYSRIVEKRLWSIASGLPLWVAPLTTDGLEAYAREHRIDPNTAAARSQYAAELLRIGRAAPRHADRGCRLPGPGQRSRRSRRHCVRRAQPASPVRLHGPPNRGRHDDRHRWRVSRQPDARIDLRRLPAQEERAVLPNPGPAPRPSGAG